MTKRAVKRMVREGAYDAVQYDSRHEDSKIRRLPTATGWSPHGHIDERDQAYLKTIKPKSPGQEKLIAAMEQKNLVMALGPAGTGKTYLAIAKAVEALEAGKVGRIVLSRLLPSGVRGWEDAAPEGREGLQRQVDHTERDGVQRQGREHTGADRGAWGHQRCH